MSTRCPPPTFEHKIVPMEELARRAAELPKPVVFTNGVFDILHRGHVTYLAQARALGASLVVAVNSDASVRMLGKGDDRPINTEADRAAVKGGDYRPEDLPEAKLAATWGGKCVTITFEHERSTTALLRKVRAQG